MFKKFTLSILLLILVCISIDASQITIQPSDRICGKWRSDKKNCIVQVFKDGEAYKAKLLWFDDSDEPGKPMETRTDIKNPDVNLRSRKLIGMNVLEDLTYKPKTNSWENGMIYDAQSGKKWNSSASLTLEGTLKVTGYWHFKFIGRTMGFHRVQ
ncbi:DUF2147 domain-containing protein [Mucilaginibacter terrae]|uniref:DUF2147 domain-containing protein n=1 Tax=Mucilaginibacter terrae TaxID=1955052 RepID=UPI00362CAC44